ncbi:uncharacterized protein [Pseudorasbora parva]|uniref:uncharacterized protein n=1 Tax=Pseudorasbora parva TaxID=51549 RepID=UPI00351F5BED
MMDQSDTDSRHVLHEPTVRPRRSVRLPSYLSDFELTDHQPRFQSRQRVDSSPEMSDDSELLGAAAPKLAHSSIEYRASMQSKQPLIEWSPSSEYEQQRAHTYPVPELSSEVLVEFQQLRKETDELRRRSSEQIRKLEERNEALEAQLSLLAVSDRSSHHPQSTSSPVPQPRVRTQQITTDNRPIPLPRFKLSQRMSENTAESFRQDRLHDLERRLQQLERTSQLTSSRPTPRQTFHQTPHDRGEDSRSGYSSNRVRLPPSQETTYRGPAPTIPNFCKSDPREFSRLRIALENILPADATERFKYQILVDHLKLEEALLIADSYCNSSFPFSETMEALNQQYGQPHQLALQRIAELMDGPNVSHGDVRAFRMFALKVRSLVSMLQQLGNKGYMELECGSHVSRLLCKLPHDLQTSFRRSVHPQQVPIPTLLDLSTWLEFELQVQEDSTRFYPLASKPLPIHKRGPQRDSRQPVKATSIFLGTEKEISDPLVKVPDPKPRDRKVFCPYCDAQDHYLNGCASFQRLNRDQKVQWIQSHKRCWRCGRAHQAAQCNLRTLCKSCNRRHLNVLHEVNDRGFVKTPERPTIGPSESCLVNTTTETLYLDRPTDSRRVLLKICKVLLRNGNHCLETYALLDDGSERTILLHSAAQQLELTGRPEELVLRTVRQDLHKLRGASVTFTVSPASQPKTSFRIHQAFTAETLGLAEHTYPVEELQRKFHHLQGLQLPHVQSVQPLLLIGSDYPALITPVEPVRLGPPNGPAAIKTRLGWTLQGPTQEIKHRLPSQQCLFTATSDSYTDLYRQVEKLWQLDVLPYRSEKLITRSKQDHEAISLLESKTIRVPVDGVARYATPLLRVKDMPLLQASADTTLPCLRGIERRLARDAAQAEAYQVEMNKLKEAGYARVIPPGQVDQAEEAWYIPHHMTQHNDKKRVVFNCSFQHGGKNLNQLLLPGPTLGPSLLSVLLRFREHAVALSSDIRGMFHQVRLLPEDRPLLRFLWRDLNREKSPQVYEWQVLPFGTTCSPCCATFALQKHVIDHSHLNEDVRYSIEKSFYVDNFLQSFCSQDEASALASKLRDLLATGGFDLRQWASNIPQVLDHIPAEAKSSSLMLLLTQGQPDTQESALGLQWQCNSDTLAYKYRPIKCSAPTMRHIYKVLASQYDPLGYIIPYTTRAKVLVQRLWDKKRDWDDPHLPEELLQAWLTWEQELPNLQRISLPRCYVTSELDNPQSIRDIHIFCDASERAYGSVAYLRTLSPQGDVEISFLTARSRVSPKKQQSIPRLELCAALTGAQLAKLLKAELSIPLFQVTLWSDSTTVLAWIQAESCRFKVFIGTRVAEIQDMTDPKDWRYVDSKSNSADDITRGKTLAELAKPSRWCKGPPFLLLPPDQWPQSPPIRLPANDVELKQGIFCGLTVPVTDPALPDSDQFESYNQLLTSTARVLHGAANGTDTLTAEDYRKAELALLHQAQTESFPVEIAHLKSGKPLPLSSRLLCLAPEYDSNTHLIRVGGRLRRTDQLDEFTIHPIVLEPKHPLSRLIIKDFDETLHHPGPERVFAEMRRKYWILRGREAIRQHQRNCLGCRQWRGQPSIPRMADLPPSRLRLLQPAFYSTGVDCFGPYFIKIGRRQEKRWGIIFKCLTTRSVYLDLLYQMDTDSFLMALRRFISRRGKPFEIISDQGTNFRGGVRALQEDFAELQPSLQEQLASHQISFKFNPPGAAHFGGCWEREIRSLKSALCSTIGDQIVTEEVLRTVLVEIEGILNAKPLGYTSSDVADPDPVTPNMLLMGRHDSSLPQVVYPESELLSKRRWRHSQLLADHFWRRFLRNYLPELQVRQKWHRESENLKPGTVVMIVDHQLPRALWPVGQVTKVFPGEDGRARTAEVEVKKKTYLRPITRLISLPALPD